MFLTPDDVQRLTGKKRFSAQRRVLDARKIRYILGGESGQEPLVFENWDEPPRREMLLPREEIEPLDRDAVLLPLAEIRAMRQLYHWNMGDFECGVYFLFLRWALVYVGQSVCLHQRINGHRWASLGRGAGKRIPFNKVAMIEVPRPHLDEVELHYIRALKPAFNVRGALP